MLTKGIAPVELFKINQVLSYGKGDMTQEVMTMLDKQLWKQAGFDNFAGLVYAPMPHGFESTRDVFRHWFRNSTRLLNQINDALPDEDIHAITGTMTVPHHPRDAAVFLRDKYSTLELELLQECLKAH